MNARERTELERVAEEAIDNAVVLGRMSEMPIAAKAAVDAVLSALADLGFQVVKLQQVGDWYIKPGTHAPGEGMVNAPVYVIEESE